MATLRLARPIRASFSPDQRLHAPLPSPKPVDLSRRHLLTGGALTSLCACCPPLLAPSPARAEAWAYTCASAGPSAWEGVCAAGLQQSPINIPLPLPKHQADLQPIRFTEYPRFLKAAASNPGHGTMHVEPQAEVTCQIGGQPFRLVQLHFHTPSEHAVSGRHAAMEAHLVHRSPDTGALAVLAVLIHPDGPVNASLGTILESAPQQPGSPPTPLRRPINLLSLLPRPSSIDGRRAYARYRGSLTTPPCSEGVQWYVFLEPLKVAADQILEFQWFAGNQVTLGSNARPIQPLGDRQLAVYT